MTEERPEAQGPEQAQPGPAYNRPPTQTLVPPHSRPWVNYALMGVTILIYLAQLFFESLTGTDFPFLFLGKINDLIRQGQFWRLITPLFLHASILHLAVNMYAMYAIGTGLEALYGHGRYLALYLLSGFGGYALSFALTKNPALGASAGVFGLLAAQGVLVWQNKTFFGPRTKQILSNLAMILVVNLAIGFFPGSRIDNFGHLGGLFAGGLFALLGGPHWELRGNTERLRMADQRQNKDVLLAGVMVFVGFAAVVALAFFRP